VQELTWDYRNRLVAFVDKDAAGKETQRVEFTYDAFNRRIAKAIDTNPQDTTPAVVTQFVYDGSNVLLEFVDSDGAGANQPVLDKRYLHGAGVDQVLAQEIAGNVVWLLTDHLGTVRDLVNNSGAVVNHLVYDSYGQVISESNPAVDTRYLFTGREFDSETGLYYYRARYYDQTMGRFLSEDPIGFDGKDNNLYRYVFNSPLMFNDPSGNIIPLICVALGITELDLLFLAGLTAIGINTVNNQQQNSQNNSPLENRSSSGDDDSIKGGHDKNKRPSSQEKHEKGDERRGRDQGGEKGDARRRPNPNKRR
jgi:RHS repeat-associated protein